MNVLEQLQSLGFREEPYQYEDGGDVGADGSMGFGIEGGSYGGVGYGNVGYGGAGDVSPDALAAIVAANVSQDAASPAGREAMAALEALDTLGYGRMEGLNAANPTQSVQELIASYNFSLHGAPAIIAAIPGASTAANIAQLASNLSTGKTTVGAEAVDFALSQLASSLGINKGMAVAMINGDFGKAAAGTAMGVFNSALAQATGLPAGVVGFGMNISGTGKAIGSEIASAVNAATGVAPTDNVGAMGRALDQAFGVGPGGTSTGATGTDVSDVAGVTGGDGAPGVVDATGADVAGGPSSVAPAGFDLSGLAPLLGIAALEDILTPKEKEEQEKEQKRIASPFGMMPYA